MALTTFFSSMCCSELSLRVEGRSLLPRQREGMRRRTHGNAAHALVAEPSAGRITPSIMYVFICLYLLVFSPLYSTLVYFCCIKCVFPETWGDTGTQTGLHSNDKMLQLPLYTLLRAAYGNRSRSRCARSTRRGRSTERPNKKSFLQILQSRNGRRICVSVFY
jgi:hypothetical protein